jgi:hypothetical protein
LRGTCYVGRAFINGLVVEISEKFAGAFETLVSLGPLKAPKVMQTPSPVAKSSGSTAILVSLFVRSVRAYLSGFKKVAYVRVPDAGTVAGGRLDVTRTLRLRAKGKAHQIAFDRSVLSADLPFNRCIFAALREIEHLAKLENISALDVAGARALGATLAECLPAVLSARPGELADIAAREAAARHARPESRDVISLAGAILDAAGFGGRELFNRQVERSWFVNLETFFEEAIRNVVAGLLGAGFSVSSAQERPPVFSQLPQRYRANPDLVIRNDAGTVAIGDAKYKELDGWPTPADVHELLVHASAYRAPKALLFFPSDGEFWQRSFGKSSSGCDVWLFGIRFNAFAADVGRSLELADLLPPHAAKTSSAST